MEKTENRVKKVNISSGERLHPEEEANHQIYLIIRGEVRVSRGENEHLGFLRIFGPGDIIHTVLPVEGSRDERIITAITDVEAIVLEDDKAVYNLDEFPEAVREWIWYRIQIERQMKGRCLSALERLYAFCSLLYTSIYTHISLNNKRELRSPVRFLLEELTNTLAPPLPPLVPLLRGLSKVGLVDLKEGDTFNPTVHIPDVKLYHSFLSFIQEKAGLPRSIYGGLMERKPTVISDEAALIIDSLLSDNNMAVRTLEPERAMIHLSEEQLLDLYQVRNYDKYISLSDASVYELQHLGAFTLVEDENIKSVFINLRNILRINLLRDIETNFCDITEYLCELIGDLSKEQDGRIFRIHQL